MTLDFTAARTHMLDSQVRTNDVPDVIVQDALAVAPRERFCAPDRAFLAYADAEIEYAPGFHLLRPRDIAKLLQVLAPRPGETAICLAAPYAAMVLATIGLHVTLRLPAGPARAVADKALEGYAIATDAGELALPLSGPFDLAIVEGAVAAVPQAWLDSLARHGREGARLAVIERTGPAGKARLYRRTQDGTLGSRDVFDATPAFLPGLAPVASFAF